MKLQVCFQAQPGDLDILVLIARAFDGMGETAKALEVRKQAAKTARETGRADLFQQLMRYLLQVAPNDPVVRALAQ